MKIKDVSPGQWIAFSVIAACTAATIILAPEHFWEKLSEASPATIALWVTTVGTAIVGVFLNARKSGPALALLVALSASGCAEGATAWGVANTVRSGTCVICAKLAELGVCVQPSSGGDAPAAEETSP